MSDQPTPLPEDTFTPFDFKFKEPLLVNGSAWTVTPCKDKKGKLTGSFAFFLDIENMPSVSNGDLHFAFTDLITYIRQSGYVARVCPDNRSLLLDGVKRRVGGHMVYANLPKKPPFQIKVKGGSNNE